MAQVSGRAGGIWFDDEVSAVQFHRAIFRVRSRTGMARAPSHRSLGARSPLPLRIRAGEKA
jgi:hypothetical protein